MAPRLRPGALVVVDERAYERTAPRRGEVVVARPAWMQGKACIKRVIGTSQDELIVKDHHWRLGENEYFLIGDAQTESVDSRQAGPVRRAELVGRVRFQV